MNVLTDKVKPSSSPAPAPAEDVRERTERELREAARSAKLVQGAIACGTLLAIGLGILFFGAGGKYLPTRSMGDDFGEKVEDAAIAVLICLGVILFTLTITVGVYFLGAEWSLRSNKKTEVKPAIELLSVVIEKPMEEALEDAARIEEARAAGTLLEQQFAKVPAAKSAAKPEQAAKAVEAVEVEPALNKAEQAI